MATPPVGDKVKINYIIHMSNTSKVHNQNLKKNMLPYDCVADTSHLYTALFGIITDPRFFFFFNEKLRNTLSAGTVMKRSGNFLDSRKPWLQKYITVFPALLPYSYFIMITLLHFEMWDTEATEYPPINKQNSLLIMSMNNQKEKR